MTVPTSTAKSGPYAGAGTTGPFTVGFRFLENSHLQVIKTSTLGVDSTLTLTSDYTVTGAGGTSGAITLTSALAVGEKLTVLRNVPFTQQADYVQNDAFPAESHERALDLLTMQTQQLAETVSRAATVPASTNDAAGLADAITELSSNSASVVAVAGALPDVELVADNIADVNTVADNIADVTNFADVYQGPKASDPALRNDGTALQDGDLYFNTTTNSMRVYGGTWGDVGTALPITINEQALNGTGSQTVFTLSSAPAYTAALEVFVGGVRQSTTTVYSVSGTTLTFTAAPPAGTGNIFCRWVSPIVAGVPADGSVSTAKIADAAVTTSKLADSAVTDAKIAAMAASKLTGDVAAARITTALNASGTAPIYAARAWVNFNGTGTVAILASGNVSSITDNGVGDYTVNFTTAMPDTSYVLGGSAALTTTSSAPRFLAPVGTNGVVAGSCQIRVADDTGANNDCAMVSVIVHR